MTTSNHIYNKIDKKIFISMIIITILYFIFCVATCFNMTDNLEFYKNAKHI